jgi:thiamine pyrophosphokinase
MSIWRERSDAEVPGSVRSDNALVIERTFPAAATAVVFAGGAPVDPDRLPALPRHVLRIAADGGLAQASLLGLEVHVVIGDMDSVADVDLRRAEASGAEVVRHPADKDATDLELALHYAADRGCDHVVIVGGLGGRLDHFVGNALLLGNRRFAATGIEWITEEATLTVVRAGERRELETAPGNVVSLLPLGGDATGVRASGLRWPLTGETLVSFSTRGLSNEALGRLIDIEVESGVLLVVRNFAPDE